VRKQFMTSRIAMAGVVGLAALTLSACGGSDETSAAKGKGKAASTPAATMKLSSTDVAADGKVPAWARGKYPEYCESGENRSPSFTWTAPPAGTKSLVMMMTDLTVVGYTHWVVMDIPPTTTSLASAPQGKVTTGVLGRTISGPSTYLGPCVVGNIYQYTIYALDQPLGGSKDTSIVEAEPLMAGHVLAKSSLSVHL
jgi:Raf kinase inhibitor-like YbhB/YbcL family protein